MEICFSVDKPAKIMEWAVKEGSWVPGGRVILSYSHNDLNEPNGQSTTTSIVNRRRVNTKMMTSKGSYIKIKSPQSGVITKILAAKGSSITIGTPLYLLDTNKSCSHPTVIQDLCAECGVDLQKLDDKIQPTASVSMVHSVPDLRVSKEQAQILGKGDEQRLLKQKKLVLLVDLDQTLIHTTNDCVPNNLKDVFHFQLWGHGSVWYHTRLRPHTRDFLERMNSLYELHICTFGTRSYAHRIAHELDPDKKYFFDRILSRDECFSQNSKTANLKELFPRGDHMVCIIDDREDVWNFAPNLIHVKPYHFFRHTGDINAPPGLSKKDEDDKSGFEFKDSKADENKEKVVPDPHSDSKEVATITICDPDSNTEVYKENVKDVSNDLLLSDDEESDLDRKDEDASEGDKEESPDEEPASAVTEIVVAPVILKIAESKIHDSKQLSTENEIQLETSKCSEDQTPAKVEPMSKIPETGTVSESSEALALPESLNEDNDKEQVNADENVKSSITNEAVVNEKSSIKNAVLNEESSIRNAVLNEKSSIINEAVLNEESSIKNEAVLNEESSIKNAVLSEESSIKNEAVLNEESSIKNEAVLNEESSIKNEAVLDEKSAPAESTTAQTENCKTKHEAKDKEDGEFTDSSNTSSQKTLSQQIPDSVMEVDDEDDYLLYLEDILKSIHEAFYNLYKEKQSRGEADVPDIKHVIPYVRLKVLKGCGLVFSGVVPTEVPLTKSRPYAVAKMLGAQVSDKIVPISKPGTSSGTEIPTTHVVAARMGTAKVNEARRYKGIQIVTPNWLWCCAERWRRVDERLFPLYKKSNVKRNPPAHCSSPELSLHHSKNELVDCISPIDCDPGVFSGKASVAKPAVRKERTPSGRFMDTINPLLTFSMDEIESMGHEVDDICNESESSSSDGSESKSKKERITRKKKPRISIETPVQISMNSNTSSSDDSESKNIDSSQDLCRAGKRKRLLKTETETEDEPLSAKFRRGEPLPSDLDCLNLAHASTDDDTCGNDQEDEWMAEALEREFLDSNSQESQDGFSSRS